MRKLFILTLAVVLVFGMSAVGMAQDNQGTVDVYQDGSDHFANIEQDPGSRGTTANLSQYGTNQFADIVQTNDVGWLNAVQRNQDNVLVADQTGYDVTGLIRQTLGTSDSYVSLTQANRSDARVYQKRQWDSAVVINQNSLSLMESHWAYVEQYEGQQNFASIDQVAHKSESDMDGHSATILQGGVENIAIIEQTSEKKWGNSSANVNQYGDNNYANVFQEGSNHSADLDQTGNNNIINVDQTKMNNNASVEQIGSDNVTNVIQN